MSGYNQEYFQDRGPSWKDEILAIQWLETIGLTPKSKIYDVGCGTGKFVHIFRNMGFDAIGYDPNIPRESIFGLASGFVSNTPLNVSDCPLIINVDALEHLNNEAEVDSMLKHIEESGKEWFIFSICDLEHWEQYQDATHKFCRSRTWWETKLAQYFKVYDTPTDWLYYRQMYLARKKQGVKN